MFETIDKVFTIDLIGLVHWLMSTLYSRGSTREKKVFLGPNAYVYYVTIDFPRFFQKNWVAGNGQDPQPPVADPWSAN